MRTATFEVPAELVVSFSEKMTELELTNEIVGKNEYDEILIEVSYDKDESDQVDELEEYLEELVEEFDQEDEKDEKN